MHRPRLRRLLATLAGLALLVLTGCQATATVQVKVAENGSGTVTVRVHLDAEAAAKLPNLEGALQLKGIQAAGWTVSFPKAAADGSRDVVATASFRDPAGANALLAQISGPNGPLKDVKVTRSTGFGSVTTKVTGTIDLSKGEGTFVDGPLAQSLGQPVTNLLGGGGSTPTADQVRVTVSADLPGASAPKTWTAGLGQAPVLINGSATSSDSSGWLFVGTAVLAGVGAIAAGFFALRARHREIGPRFMEKPPR